MVQGGKGKQARHFPQRPPHFLRPAANKRRADIYGAAVDVPFRHKHNQCLCRPAEQDKVQSPEETASVFTTVKKSSKFIHTYNVENQY